MAHQVIAVQEQDLGIVLAGGLQPFLKRNAVDDILWNELVIERGDQAFIDQDIMFA